MAFAVAFFCPAGIKLHPRQGGQSRPCFLKQLGIRVCAYTKSIGPVACESFCQEEISRNPLCMPDADASLRAQAYLEACMKQQDSCGGVGGALRAAVPPGAGEPRSSSGAPPPRGVGGPRRGPRCHRRPMFRG